MSGHSPSGGWEGYGACDDAGPHAAKHTETIVHKKSPCKEKCREISPLRWQVKGDVSPPRRRVTFGMPQKSPKGHHGSASGKILHLRLYFHSPDPFTGDALLKAGTYDRRGQNGD